MGTQAVGPIGFAVDRMIRRSVKKNFHGTWWIPPEKSSNRTIFVANHHGWYDGYLMYHVVTRLGLPSLDWIAEFDAFPQFRYVGGMPFSPSRPEERGATIRKTIRAMKEQEKSLILFGEGILHRPPEILRFGKSLQLIGEKVPQAVVVPVAIRYEMSMHERPEAFICLGPEQSVNSVTPESVRLAVKSLLDECAVKIVFDRDKFQSLAPGTPDVNERWDMRRLPWNRGSEG